ncbi:MAG: archaeal/vacuolar-type H+-ATPase subunit E [halophilic archaeon J07HX5]|nr:MAG: archaeal/vacuolar-type H+-ATPase subunit E [halophilic archaeon J07HX5]
MSLDTVADDIEQRAQERARELREQAEADAEEIREQAQREADEITDQRLAEIEETIEQERERERSNAALEAKQQRLKTRREQLDTVQERVASVITDIEGDRRRELTAQLLADAAADVDEPPAAVYSRAADEELLTELLEEYDGFSYAGEYDCLGGVVVESEASQVRIRNTFDSVYEEVWEANLGTVSDRLFDEQ